LEPLFPATSKRVTYGANAPAPTNAGDDVMLPDAGKQDFQPASLGVGFQKGGLLPGPIIGLFI
jgi:hypothetical protein